MGSHIRRLPPFRTAGIAMNAVPQPVRASAAQWRERLLGATAQASRLLLESSDVMARMREVLQLIGEAAEVDRTTLAVVDVCPDGQRWLEIRAQWTAPGFVTRDAAGNEVVPGARRMDCFCGELGAGRSVHLCGDDWRADRSIASAEARSSIIVPFMVDGAYAGAVGFDSLHAERQFDSAVVSALEIAASVIGAALQRERLLETMRREREAAAEQRVAELARANAALRTNLERLASYPTEFFSHLLLETVRHAGAEAATAVVSGQESEDWMVVCHSRDGRVTEAEFASSMPVRDSQFMQQMAALREPLHLPLHGGAGLPAWPELIDFHRGAGHGSLLVLPLVFGDRNLGVVGLGFRRHEPLRSELVELLVALAQQVTLALALKRLFHSSRQAAVLAERNRIGREIHDGLAQAFTGILMQLGAAEEQAEGSPLVQVLNRIRDIAREGLTSPGGLELALRQLAERSTVDGRIVSTFHGGGATGLPPEHEHALLRIAQEAVINAVRHARPRNIEIHLTSEDDVLLLCVRDDGIGMHHLPDLYARQGFGLANMRERAEALGGLWQIQSEPDAGTRVSVRIPRAARAQP